MIGSRISIIKWIFMALAICSIGNAYYEDILIDFNETSELKDSPEVKLKYLFNGHWKVKLNSSADFVENRQLSYTATAEVNNTKEEKVFVEQGKTSGNVMGFRIHFPKWDANAFASIKPAYEIDAYAGNEGNMFVGKGLIQNVGTIKSIIALVKGKNFPHSFYIDLKDGNGQVTSHFMGYLDFEGWNERVYANPHYIRNLRFKKNLIKPFLYPRVEPFIKLDGITFFRHGDKIGGDFIAYIAWIKIQYDKAIIEEEDDIDDEKTWGILKKLSQEKGAREAARRKHLEELEALERKKMNLPENATIDPSDTEEGITPPDDLNNQGSAEQPPAGEAAQPPAAGQ